MNIVILCKENYLKAAETLLHSLGRQTDRKLMVYLLYNEISAEKIEKLRCFVAHKCHGCLKEINVDASVFDNMPLNTHFTRETYFRLLMPKLLPAGIQKVLYLDVDMVIRKPVDELYDTDFDGKAVVACASRWEPMRLEKEKLPVTRQHVYFNAGVMLYNIEKIRADFEQDFLIQCMEKNREKLRYLDQDVLNIAFCENVKYVNWEIYDFQTVANERFTGTELKEIEKKAAIIHYLGDVKPWDMKLFYKNQLKREYFKAVKKKGDSADALQIFLCRPVSVLFHSIKGFICRRIIKRGKTDAS